MSLFRIAWRSIQQRGLASFLTTVSMALGVMMVVAVLSVHGVVSKSFRNNSSLGYNLIVGAKGGKLQLTMSTVYYLSAPVENIPYEYFLEFHPAERRKQALQNSLRAAAHQTGWQALDSLSLAQAGPAGLAGLGAVAAQASLEAVESAGLDAERDGKFSQFTAFAIPVCLGDFFGRFRVVGTTPEMFELVAFGPASDQKFEFAEGRNFEHWNEEHGYFEAVVGATVAREMGVRLGDGITPSHADPEGAAHGDQFTVVGILELSGTPNDRAVFINMEGFYLMEGHAKPVETSEEDSPAGESSNGSAGESEAGVADDPAEDPAASAAAPPGGSAGQPTEEESVAARAGDQHQAAAGRRPLPLEQREVTSILVRTTHDLFAMNMENSINEGREAQCVQPIREITVLFDEFVGPVKAALLVVTALICVVSGISILVSIYNSMSDRKHEIAVMRALGASRETVMTIILLESVMLSILGGLLGWTAAHTMNAVASPAIEARTGVSIGFWDMGQWYWYDLEEQAIRSQPLAGVSDLFQVNRMTGALVVALLVLLAGTIMVSWQAFTQHGLGWAAVVFLLPPVLWVYAILHRQSRVARWGVYNCLLGLGLFSLYPLFHFGIPLNMEFALVPSLVLLAVVVGFLPAIAGYRTDVARSLGS